MSSNASGQIGQIIVFICPHIVGGGDDDPTRALASCINSLQEAEFLRGAVPTFKVHSRQLVNFNFLFNLNSILCLFQPFGGYLRHTGFIIQRSLRHCHHTLVVIPLSSGSCHAIVVIASPHTGRRHEFVVITSS